MPTTPYAKLLVSVNGGATTSGGLTVSNGDVIQLSGESTVGWTQQRWEIYSFFSTAEFPLPAGWTDAGSGVYFSTAVTPPPFTLPASTKWGKWLLRLTVNGGLRNGVADATLKDESTALSILSSAGLRDLAHLESNQFDAVKKWVGDQQKNLRAIESSIGAGGNVALPPIGTSLQTTNATPTAAITIPFANDAALTGAIHVIATTTGTGIFQGSTFGFLSVTNAGVLSSLGVPLNATYTSYVGPQPSIDQVYAANELTVRVIGLAATNIKWVLRADFLVQLAP